MIVFSLMAGAFGGLIRSLVSDKGLLLLPAILLNPDGTKSLSLGLVGPILIGAFAGLIAQGTPIIAALAGYAGTDFIENAVDLFLKGEK